VIVDPQAQLRVRLGRMDQQRRRLLAPFVAAGGFACFERGKQRSANGS
jgi:hypothetical protein